MFGEAEFVEVSVPVTPDVEGNGLEGIWTVFAGLEVAWIDEPVDPDEALVVV